MSTVSEVIDILKEYDVKHNNRVLFILYWLCSLLPSDTQVPDVEDEYDIKTPELREMYYEYKNKTRQPNWWSLSISLFQMFDKLENIKDIILTMKEKIIMTEEPDVTPDRLRRDFGHITNISGIVGRAVCGNCNRGMYPLGNNIPDIYYLLLIKECGKYYDDGNYDFKSYYVMNHIELREKDMCDVISVDIIDEYCSKECAYIEEEKDPRGIIEEYDEEIY